MHICMDQWGSNFDWNHARAFLATAEEGSLSAAARKLKVAQPTLGRQVKALEAELDVVLFERAGRGLILTPSGHELLAHVQAMGAAANAVSLTSAGQSETLEGSISITASDIYAGITLPPILSKLRLAEPGIRIEIIADNSPNDLRKREADIAIRNFRPKEPDLIAKKIRDAEGCFYASPEYLDRIGNPKTEGDLKSAEFIEMDSAGGMMDHLNTMGLNLTKKNFPILSENHLVMWELVKNGAGIGVCDGLIGDTEPRVQRVIPNMEPVFFPVWLVVHREVNTSRRVRRVFDFLAVELSKTGE